MIKELWNKTKTFVKDRKTEIIRGAIYVAGAALLRFSGNTSLFRTDHDERKEIFDIMTAVSYRTFFIIVALMFGLTAIALLYIWVLAKKIEFVNRRIDKIRDHIHM